MSQIVLEVGKTYRNNAGHLILVKSQHTEESFICVRECHGHCATELFKSNGYPAEDRPVSDRFQICEEVTTGKTVSNPNPKPFSLSFPIPRGSAFLSEKHLAPNFGLGFHDFNNFASTLTDRTIISDDNSRTLFEIRIDEDGSYMAMRTQEPFFCMVGSTIQEACQKAEDALDSYKDLKTP